LLTLKPEYDVAIIGGGINGAGVARDAAMRGLRVLLLEKQDFGSGTSSRTSKMIHGGIRYLEHGALRLVWESCHERRTLLAIAPHLVRPLAFVLPVFRDSRVGRLRLRLGLWLYDLLAAFRNVHRHRVLGGAERRQRLPGLRTDGLRAAALYWDATMDDARLVLENVLAAREAGADVLSRVVTQTLTPCDGGFRIEVADADAGVENTVRARTVVVCAGPWTDQVLCALRLGTSEGARIAPTRGSHLVTRRFTDQAFTLTAERDGRVFFVLPWLDCNLIGTTDVDAGPDPDAVQPSPDEIDYLLSEANRFFPAAQLGPADVVAAFAGLRPLLASAGTASARPREHALVEVLPGLMCVVGGKYTTYRAVAAECVDRIAACTGSRQRCTTAAVALPGARFAWSAAEQWEERGAFAAAAVVLARGTALTELAARHLLRTYGSRAEIVAELVRREAGLAGALCPHHPHLRAEVVHAVRHEMARHLEDWFLRRTRTAFHRCHGTDAVEAAADLFAAEIGWDAGRRRAEIAAAHAAIDAVALTDSRASTHPV
jgi:glycerol-3-phosphate dehydrogenase